MVGQSRSVFLQALIGTIIVFIIGLVLGFALENNRIDKTELTYLNSEVNFLDEQARSLNLNIFNVSCELAAKDTLDFADRIYREALLLEEYDSSSKFTDELRIIHKKYDLLRMMLWAHSIENKEKCPENFHTVVYLFDYGTEDIDERARQISISRQLSDLKGKYGDEVLLIPIAANLDLQSIELVKQKFDIMTTPAIIIDEERVVTKEITLSELEEIVFESGDFESLRGVLFDVPNLDRQEKLVLNG